MFKFETEKAIEYLNKFARILNFSLVGVLNIEKNWDEGRDAITLGHYAILYPCQFDVPTLKGEELKWGYGVGVLHYFPGDRETPPDQDVEHKYESLSLWVAVKELFKTYVQEELDHYGE